MTAMLFPPQRPELTPAQEAAADAQGDAAATPAPTPTPQGWQPASAPYDPTAPF